MRNIVAAEFLSLDGVMQDPGGVGEFEHGGWTNPYYSDEMAPIQQEQLFASDALLLGRVTYEGFAAAWPSMEEATGDFGVRMNSLPKFVASRTLRAPLEWNATLLEGDLADAVAKLKQQPGQDILIYGSGELVSALMGHHLIDRLQLMVFPIALGTGKRLFRDGVDKTPLKLTEVKPTSTGVVVLTYEAA